MGKGSIDLGLPTEDKPEWTISLDFVESPNEEPTEWTISQEPENIPAQGTTSTQETSFSGQNSSALDSGFLLDGNISSPGSQNAGGAGMLNTGGVSGALDGSISSAGDAVLGGGGAEMLNESSDTMIQMPQKQEDSSAILGENTATNPQSLSDVMLDTPVQAPAEQVVNQPEPEPEPASQPEPAPEPDIPNELEKETDEVEERLNHLANSMSSWEESEKALSEAAAMLSAKRMQRAGQNESELKNLFDRLDISENLDRMNATVQEDLADVIEQTEQDELLEAKNAMSVEENTVSPDIEISNDMFDLGVDLSDDDNFSDENIDLSSFKGSIKDADEINKPSENSIDLDEAETTSDSVDSGLDMSNLVAAAMNNISGSTETPEAVSPEPEPDMEPVEENNSSLTFDTGTEPETNEGSLEFMTGAEESQPEMEPVEENNSSLTFDTGTEPETSEGSLEFMTGAEESQPEMEPVEENSSLTSDAETESGLQGSFEFAAATVDEQPEAPSEVNEEESTPEFDAAPPETEEMNLKFEPVYPDADTPEFSNIIDDSEASDIASMIIEDYSEVPTVSGIENKLSKHEKEKKRNKSKESRQNKEDGFAFSLDDISTGEEISRNPVVEAALEVAADTLAVTNQEAAATAEPKEIKRRTSTQHIVHKDGKLKRSYYKLFYI